MSALIAFRVDGRAMPQGSLRAFVRGERAVVTHSRGPQLDLWRIAMAAAARTAMAGAPLMAGPVSVHLLFRMARPKSHTGARGLRPSAPAFPSTRPDIDKLARGALDAFSGIVFGDDAQVAQLRVTKAYEAGWIGVAVVVATLEHDADPVLGHPWPELAPLLPAPEAAT